MGKINDRVGKVSFVGKRGFGEEWRGKLGTGALRYMDGSDGHSCAKMGSWSMGRE